MRKRIGLTIIELILALALSSLVIGIGANLMVFGMKNTQLTYDEFDIQSNVRLMSQKINTTIRDSAATFVLHRDDANALTEEWNYIMLNSDKTKLIEHKWNPTSKTHDEIEIFKGISGVTLNLEFKKDSNPNEDRLLAFKLEILDNGKLNTIESELESNNSLQVVDRSYLETANTLAYRFDSRIDEVSNSQAAVSMVLDISGSMESNLGGKKKITQLREESTTLINALATKPNIYISLNPFSNDANGSLEMKEASSRKASLISDVNSMNTINMTNTGDGIRRGYHRIVDFNDSNVGKTNKNFMVVLVDGNSNYSSIKQIVYNPSDVWLKNKNGETYEKDRLIYDYDGYYRVRRNLWRHVYKYNGPNYNIFEEGNQNIVSTESPSNNEWYDDARLKYGESYALGYIEDMGEKVRTYKEGTNEAIKVYIIGYAQSINEINKIKHLAEHLTGDENNYEHADSQAALNIILASIQKDISDALWHIGGPN